LVLQLHETAIDGKNTTGILFMGVGGDHAAMVVLPQLISIGNGFVGHSFVAEETGGNSIFV